MLADRFRTIIAYIPVVRNFVARHLKVRYRRSVLGFLWTMINPIVMTCVFVVLFSQVFQFPMSGFVIYFLSGYLVWNFFSESTATAASSMLSNAPMYKKVYIPKAVFVISIVLSSLINFCLALIPLLVLILVMGKGLQPALLFVPIPTVFGILFTLGISLALAAASVFFTDIIEMYRLLLLPWMYLTPIFYPMDIIPANFVPFLKLNPMYYLVECFRAPIYSGLMPDLFTIGCAGAVSALTFVAGWIMFEKLQDSFVYYV